MAFLSISFSVEKCVCVCVSCLFYNMLPFKIDLWEIGSYNYIQKTNENVLCRVFFRATCRTVNKCAHVELTGTNTGLSRARFLLLVLSLFLSLPSFCFAVVPFPRSALSLATFSLPLTGNNTRSTSSCVNFSLFFLCE